MSNSYREARATLQSNLGKALISLKTSQAGHTPLVRVLQAASSPGSLPALATRPGQPALQEGAAIPATPPPAWISWIGNREQTCELTLKIPAGGQGSTEACSKVGGTETRGDMQGCVTPWGDQGPP